jgi:hypothetical protein
MYTIVFVSAIGCLSVAIVRSILIERRCRQRDRDFQEYLECIKSGDSWRAGEISSIHSNDPVFMKHLESAKALQSWIDESRVKAAASVPVQYAERSNAF